MLRKLPLTERTMNGTGIGHWRLKYFAHNLLGHLLTLLTQRLRKYPLMAGLRNNLSSPYLLLLQGSTTFIALPKVFYTF